MIEIISFDLAQGIIIKARNLAVAERSRSHRDRSLSKDGKVWIQQNMTDVDVGRELVNRGIPK